MRISIALPRRRRLRNNQLRNKKSAASCGRRARLPFWRGAPSVGRLRRPLRNKSCALDVSWIETIFHTLAVHRSSRRASDSVRRGQASLHFGMTWDATAPAAPNLTARLCPQFQELLRRGRCARVRTRPLLLETFDRPPHEIHRVVTPSCQVRADNRPSNGRYPRAPALRV